MCSDGVRRAGGADGVARLALVAVLRTRHTVLTLARVPGLARARAHRFQPRRVLEGRGRGAFRALDAGAVLVLVHRAALHAVACAGRLVPGGCSADVRADKWERYGGWHTSRFRNQKARQTRGVSPRVKAACGAVDAASPFPDPTVLALAECIRGLVPRALVHVRVIWTLRACLLAVRGLVEVGGTAHAATLDALEAGGTLPVAAHVAVPEEVCGTGAVPERRGARGGGGEVSALPARGVSGRRLVLPRLARRTQNPAGPSVSRVTLAVALLPRSLYRHGIGGAVRARRISCKALVLARHALRARTPAGPSVSRFTLAVALVPRALPHSNGIGGAVQARAVFGRFLVLTLLTRCACVCDQLTSLTFGPCIPRVTHAAFP